MVKLKTLEEQIEDYKKMNQAKNAFIAGSLDTWAVLLENDPEMKSIVIKDMKEMALSLKKSAGVIILDEE